MMVVIDAAVINLTAIAAITMECLLSKAKIKYVDANRKDAYVTFSIVPVIQLVNGNSIPIPSQEYQDTLKVNNEEYSQATCFQDANTAILSILQSKLPAYKIKVAESTAQYISQLGQVVLPEELEES